MKILVKRVSKIINSSFQIQQSDLYNMIKFLEYNLLPILSVLCLNFFNFEMHIYFLDQFMTKRDFTELEKGIALALGLQQSLF